MLRRRGVALLRFAGRRELRFAGLLFAARFVVRAAVVRVVFLAMIVRIATPLSFF
jgi:hypothetical protein